MNEKYSVLMSVYYKEKSENLQISIDSMINQTIKPDEFILVIDGPLTNDLEMVIQKYVHKYPGLFTIIRFDENKGLGPAMKAGVTISRNELIARMDSDDYVDKFRCEKQLAFFERDPDLEIVGSNAVEFFGDINNIVSVHKVPETSTDIVKFMRRRCAVIHPTVIFKKSAVIKSGNYIKLPLYEDYDLFARMILGHNIKAYNVQENLYYIRTNDDFYKRRGGIDYAKTALGFKYQMYKKKYIGLMDFIISGYGQFCVSCFPNKLRKLFYNTFLRE